MHAFMPYLSAGALPGCYLAALCLSLYPRRTAALWRLTHAATALAFALALGQAAVHLAQDGLSADVPGMLFGALISLLGWVVARYASVSLQGEPGQEGFARALLATLACVACVAGTRHLGVLVAAWAAGSLALHRLLLFYPERPLARLAAHKKFIVSRLADGCLLLALVLIGHETGSLGLDALQAHLLRAGASGGLRMAALLIAVAVLLRSAQVPVHGWLIQVMEAPTAVSALLHAGVVNLGGFVLLRLAALLSAAPAAQTLLVAVGGLTAVLGGLAMMAQASVKEKLAWSTCSQMGFLALECGLGWFDLALLHLLAHSLYKAFAFLSSGEAVRHACLRRQMPAVPLPSLRAQGMNLLILLAGMQLIDRVWAIGRVAPPLSPLLGLIVALALAPLAGRADTLGVWAGGLARALGLYVLYLFWHGLFARLQAPVAAPDALLVLAALPFLALFWLQDRLMRPDGGRFSAGLRALAQGGFALDEPFTRLALRCWPSRMPASPLAGEAPHD